MEDEKKEFENNESKIDEVKEQKTIDMGNSKQNFKTMTDKMRENPWMVSTLFLGLLSLTLIFFTFGSGNGFTGSVVAGSEAGDILLNLYESRGAEGLELNSVEEVSGVYQVNFDYQGTEIPIFITKDGKFAGSLSPVSAVTGSDAGENTQKDVPKSDVPEVELFIWSYCPYGVQAQEPMAEVASLLEDYADFKAILYYDGHGEYETQQNKIQECIQELAPEKYWSYASSFVEDIYPICSQSRDFECENTESIKLMKSLGIDFDEVLECVDSKGEDLIADASDYASQLGVTGSPTIIINGVKVSVARNAESIKTAVCEAFTEGNVPEVCGEVLDSSAAASSGNC